MSERLLPRSEVERLTGFRKTAIYARIAAGTFPAPHKCPDTGTVRWLESEVSAWIEAVAREWPVVGPMAGRREAA